MTVEFGPEQEKALERLADTYGTTKAAILRFGLSLFLVADREARQGRSLAAVNGEQVVKELVGPWSELEPSAA